MKIADRILCIKPTLGGSVLEIGLQSGSEVTVEDGWLTIHTNEEMVAMFRMENVEAWLIKAVTK